MKPITPKDIIEQELPEFIIECTNNIIKEKWDGKRARFLLTELVTSIQKKIGSSCEQLESINHIGIEDTYRKIGWDVAYYSPNHLLKETFDAYFIFKIY